MTFIQELGSLIQRFDDLHKENAILKKEINELKEIAKNSEMIRNKKEKKQDNSQKRPSLF